MAPVGVPGAARDAIAAAKAAFALYSKSTLDERLGYLRQIQDAIARRSDVAAIMIEEYGAAPQIAAFSVEWAIKSYRNAAKLLDDVPLTRSYGTARVSLKPVGVAGLITPWNANVLIISQKLAPALAAGCTVVIKPSELELEAHQKEIESNVDVVRIVVSTTDDAAEAIEAARWICVGGVKRRRVWLRIGAPMPCVDSSEGFNPPAVVDAVRVWSGLCLRNSGSVALP